MKRLDKKGALDLLHHASLTELGEMAYKRKLELHPEKITTFVVDRNINYTNVCCIDCSFCAFYRHHKEDDAYILSFEEIGKKIEELESYWGYANSFSRRGAPKVKNRMV